MDELTPDQCRALKGKGRKYRNQPFRDEEGYWHSKGEYARWCELKALEKAGEISQLERQKKIPLHAFGGACIGYWVIDFYYKEVPLGLFGWVAEDFKGVMTELAAWKIKHAKLEYPEIVIRITKKKRRKR